MGQNPRQTVEEIEETREELARKVDELVDRAKVEASAFGKKVAIGVVALVGVVALSWFAKRLVNNDE
jgi:hypothetical protein